MLAQIGDAQVWLLELGGLIELLEPLGPRGLIELVKLVVVHGFSFVNSERCRFRFC